jgi:hypothetical protein
MEKRLIESVIQKRNYYFFQWCIDLAESYFHENNIESIKLWLDCAKESLQELKKENISSELFNKINHVLRKIIKSNEKDIYNDALELKTNFCKLYWL